MPVEIEAKMKVTELETLRLRLRERSAELIGQYLETNIFFDTEDRSLLAADEGLRLRHAHDVESGADVYTLTYKGPRQHGRLKSRDEREVTVGDAESTASLLECLGFLKVLSFQKKRQSWKFQECRIELDELPFLGYFVEIEGPREQIVLKIRDELQLKDRPLVKASYIALLATYLQEHGNAERTVKFEKDVPADAQR